MLVKKNLHFTGNKFTTYHDQRSYILRLNFSPVLVQTGSFLRSIIVSIFRIRIGIALIYADLFILPLNEIKKKKKKKRQINNWRQSPTKDIF